MLKFFLSIKTSLWLTGASIAVCIAGSFFIPQNLDVFSEINDMPLFSWLSRNSSFFDKVFWIYLLLGMMAFLCINTLVCSFDAVMKRLTWKRLPEVLSPQILHMGVIFVLLGHLISAVAGYKQDVPMTLNDPANIKDFAMTVKDIEFVNKKGESSQRWRISMEINNRMYIIEPAQPVFYKGVGFFVRAAEERKMRTIIGLVHDPGALWELIGAVLFVIGAGGIFYLKLTRKLLNAV